MKRTKIIATVGPACASPEKLRTLVKAGVDVYRINFSHGDPQQWQEAFENIRVVEQELGRPVAVCGDLCGPKIRVGMIQGGEVELAAGQDIVIVRESIEGTAERISTTLAELVDVIRPGEKILLADGRLRFDVTDTAPPEKFTCRVTVGGRLSNGKGVNLPDTDLPISALTEKDHQDIGWLAQRDFDYVALSFVQRPAEVDELRKLLDENGSGAHIIAKIEKPQAMKHIDAIIDRADAVMVARGDLGVEMDFPTVPVTQKLIAHKCASAGKPCIIATEMLESMIHSPRPTRAEASDVANAVFDRADAVMLSAESAIGEYPVEAVDAMREVLLAAESFQDKYGGENGPLDSEPRVVAALAASVRTIMHMQPVHAIAIYTHDGMTARLLSKCRPSCPIAALSSDSTVARRTCLYYGVRPQTTQRPADIEHLWRECQAVVKRHKLAESGDRLIVLAGHTISLAGGTRGLIVGEIA